MCVLVFRQVLWRRNVITCYMFTSTRANGDRTLSASRLIVSHQKWFSRVTAASVRPVLGQCQAGVGPVSSHWVSRAGWRLQSCDIFPWHGHVVWTAVEWTCLPFIRSSQNHLARHSESGKKTRKTEPEVGRQHQAIDRPGDRQIPEGSEEERKMEETGCEVICDFTTRCPNDPHG